MRVLHVGNIGNNAYLIARFLRDRGVDCHVLAYDYYDDLATPEWEGDVRPEWFAQGPLVASSRYLQALADGDEPRRRRLGRKLTVARRVPPKLRFAVRRARIAAARGTRRAPRAQRGDSGRAMAHPLVDHFLRAFPQRPDRLDEADLAPYEAALPIWQELFSRYDLVQCYSVDPIWPLVAGYRPYVAFEHGTLREIPFTDDPLGRLTALAYRESDHTFVTNGDCFPQAERLGIPSVSAMIHPLDVDLHERRDGHARALRQRYAADVVLFCPMRHDWAVKGTDVHIRALPQIRSQSRGTVLLALCRWGADVVRSERLIDDLGIRESIVWLEPMPRREFVAALQAADVVLDQMTLPHFDATVPQALAAGAPVVMSYRPESTHEIAPEPAPILTAFDEDGVAAAVRQALDAEWRSDFRTRAQTWIHRWHHPRRLVEEHLRVYGRLLEGAS